jgi:hypothetical protein
VADRPIATSAERPTRSQCRADQDAHRRTELDLAGLALGLSFAEVRERFDEIVDFAIGEFGSPPMRPVRPALGARLRLSERGLAHRLPPGSVPSRHCTLATGTSVWFGGTVEPPNTQVPVSCVRPTHEALGTEQHGRRAPAAPVRSIHWPFLFA